MNKKSRSYSQDNYTTLSSGVVLINITNFIAAYIIVHVLSILSDSVNRKEELMTQEVTRLVKKIIQGSVCHYYVIILEQPENC